MGGEHEDQSLTTPDPPEPPKREGGSNPKRHHVVAKFYLERFAVGGNVELVRRDDSQPPFLCGIERALAENYFYSVETDEGGREPLGEEFLRDHVDGAGSEAIRRLFDKERSLIAPGPREKLSFFLAFQYVRGYRVREAAVAQEKAVAQVLAKMATPSEVKRIARLRGDEVTDEEAADTAAFANSGNFKIEVARQSTLHIGLSFPMVPGLVKFFYGRHWRVLEYEEPTFITSDEPVALIGPDPEKLGSAGGLANAPEIVFPIDPRRALVMVRPDQPADEVRMPGSARQAEVINRHVAYGAHRFIVRMPGTNPLAGWTVPEKAPAVMIVPVDRGFIIGTTTNATEDDQARMAKKIQAKHGSGGPKPRR